MNGPISWQPKGQCVVGANENQLLWGVPLMMDHSSKNGITLEPEEDISTVMYKRAQAGYQINCEENKKLLKADVSLEAVWSWLDRASASPIYFRGIYNIFAGSGRKLSPANSPMEANRNKPTKKQSQQDQEPQLFIITETNKLDQRRLALQACGFGVSKPQMDQLLSELQEQGDDDKAAAWALFNGLHDRAIEILSEAKDPDKSFQRKLISMVLDKSQDASHNDTWQQLCDQLIAQVCDQPYLRAIFKYISANDWTPVLDDESLRLQERLVIALRFLDDDKLTAYLSRTLSSSILSGNLEGLMLTGLYTQGMDLLESHVNQTSDVQTAALIISLVVPRKLQDPRADEWIECYRTLLDRWQLWHHRAKFDIQRGKLMHAPEDIAPPQVYVRCTFCAQTLGHSIVAPNVKSRDGKRVNVQASMSPSSANRITSKQKSNICSSCRKALPRCALCLLHLGTPTDPIRKAITTNNVNCEDPSGFNLWFTWCQTCRHGGHAMHISEWFRKHSACPVSNCTCQCQSFFE